MARRRSRGVRRRIGHDELGLGGEHEAFAQVGDECGTGLHPGHRLQRVDELEQVCFTRVACRLALEQAVEPLGATSHRVQAAHCWILDRPCRCLSPRERASTP
jgi:hypothetical protein